MLVGWRNIPIPERIQHPYRSVLRRCCLRAFHLGFPGTVLSFSSCPKLPSMRSAHWSKGTVQPRIWYRLEALLFSTHSQPSARLKKSWWLFVNWIMLISITASTSQYLPFQSTSRTMFLPCKCTGLSRKKLCHPAAGYVQLAACHISYPIYLSYGQHPRDLIPQSVSVSLARNDNNPLLRNRGATIAT